MFTFYLWIYYNLKILDNTKINLLEIKKLYENNKEKN